jgi:hypothetical protein
MMKFCRHYWLIFLLCFVTSTCGKPQEVSNDADTKRQDVTSQVVAKLEKIVIPIINFEETSVEEAIDFLRMRSRELDAGPTEQRGISWIIKSSSPSVADKYDAEVGPGEWSQVPMINYRAKDVGLLTAVAEIARQAHRDAYLTNMGIVLCRQGEQPLPVGMMDGEEIWKILHKES